MLTELGHLYYFYDSFALLEVECERYTARVYNTNNFTLSNILTYKVGTHESSLPAPLTPIDKIEFITLVSGVIYAYPKLFSTPYSITFKGNNELVAKSFYFDETEKSGVLNLVRGHNLELEDTEFPAISYIGNPQNDSSYDDSIKQQVKLLIDSGANLDSNTCKAWLALDPEYEGESTYNNIVDKDRMGLKDFIGKPMYFNVLPREPEVIGPKDGKSYDVSNNAENTAYTTTLLQNLNSSTEIYKFTPDKVSIEDNATKTLIINELAYGRKYCIIPYETVVENSLGTDINNFKYENVYDKGEVIQAAVTQAKLTDSDVLSDFLQTLQFPDANELFLAPADVTPDGAYDAGGETELITGEYELRIHLKRFHTESRYRGAGSRSFVKFNTEYLGDATSNAEEKFDSNEGFFVNGQKVEGVIEDIRVRYTADVYDDSDNERYWDTDPIDIGNTNAADFIRTLDGFYELYTRYDDDDEQGVSDVEMRIDIDFNLENWPKTPNGDEEILGWKVRDAQVLAQDRRFAVEFETNHSIRVDDDELSWYNPLETVAGDEDLIKIRFKLSNASGSGTRYVHTVSAETGIKTLGFNRTTDKVANNIPSGSPNSPQKVGGDISVEREGVKDEIEENNNVLQESEKFRFTKGLTVTKNFDNNTYKGYLYAENDANVLYSRIKAIELITLDDDGAEDVTFTYKDGANNFDDSESGNYVVISFDATESLYNAFNSSIQGSNIKVKLYTSTTINDTNLLTYELGDKQVPTNVAFGYSRLDQYQLPYFVDDSGDNDASKVILTSEGNIDITLQDNEDLQAFGYMRRQKNDGPVYMPFILLSNDSNLSSDDTIFGYFGGTEVEMTRLDYASPVKNVASIFLGPESSSVPANFSEDADYTFEYAGSDKSKIPLIPGLSANRVSKIYAKCVIFELGIPSLAVKDTIRTIGGNNYDGKNNVISRVITGISDPFNAATGIGKTAIAAKKGLVVRQATSDEGHSNNVLLNLSNKSTAEAKQLKIRSGYDLRSVLALTTQDLGPEIFKLIRDPIAQSALGLNGSKFISNSSYAAVSDYLGLSEEDGSLVSTAGLRYSSEILNLDGSELNPIDLVTSYTNDRIFASTDRGIFSLTYAHNQLPDFTVNLTTRSSSKIKPFVFNNKISCVTSNDTILNVLDSEERRGYRDKFSGQDQKHLLKDINAGIFDYVTNNFYFSRKDGKITVALNIDEEVVGFSQLAFFHDKDEPFARIRCLKLISTSPDVTGLFSYQKYNETHRIIETKLVIASFSNESRVDFEGDVTGIEGMEELLYISEVQSNPLVLTGVTGTEGFLFPVGAQKISVSATGVDDLMVGMADPGNADNPLFKQYYEDRYGPEPVPLDFTVDSNFSWHTFLILLQIKKESAGLIQGFQAQGVIDGVR